MAIFSISENCTPLSINKAKSRFTAGNLDISENVTLAFFVSFIN
ncbi:hypothetical protein EVA_16232 [gut metagenome]|uniref:Uncharacterized protein n=1 Tax=gut metagenome TaxID=749906 RepID=J9C746_9ZZZZ